MQCNINRFAYVAASIISILLNSFASQGQTTAVLDEIPQEKKMKATQVNIDISSYLSSLLGGYGENNFHMGAQVRRINGAGNAVRLGAEYYPARYSNIDEGLRPIDAEANSITYLSQHSVRSISRALVGYQWAYPMDYGSFYFGVDLSFAYQWGRIYAQIVEDDLADDKHLYESIKFPSSGNSVKTFTYSPGFKPFIGIDLPFKQKFGLNLEAKADFMMSATKGYFVTNEAKIQKAGYAYIFNQFPLLECRLYYKISDARK